MDRLGIRQLRNATADAVQRAGNGERIVITVDGRPIAQLGPVAPRGVADRTLDDLIAAGAVIAPRNTDRPAPEDTLDVFAGARIDRAAAELRGDAGRRSLR